MRDIYKVLAKLTECNKKMVHYKSFPSGTLHLSVYCFIKEKTYLYDLADMDNFERAVLKDWSHLLGTTLPSLPPLPPLPRIK